MNTDDKERLTETLNTIAATHPNPPAFFTHILNMVESENAMEKEGYHVREWDNENNMWLWTTHEPVILINGIEIDKNIYPLIRALWSNGLATDSSCEELTEGVAHIIFTSGKDATIFCEESNRKLIRAGEDLCQFGLRYMRPTPDALHRYSVSWPSARTPTLTALWEEGNR